MESAVKDLAPPIPRDIPHFRAKANFDRLAIRPEHPAIVHPIIRTYLPLQLNQTERKVAWTGSLWSGPADLQTQILPEVHKYIANKSLQLGWASEAMRII